MVKLQSTAPVHRGTFHLSINSSELYGNKGQYATF